MEITAPLPRRPSYLPFSDTVVPLGEEDEDGSSSDDDNKSSETKVKVGAEGGWKVPVPEGVKQDWEGQWNVKDVREVQKMLRMLR
jgi:hypothetical protein